MRIRSIRPEFWSSEDIAAMDWHTRLIFIGLWSYVDDNGVGRDVDRLIAAALFPLDEDSRETLARVSRGLQALSDGGQIRRYTIDGKPYLWITGWDAHQKIDRPGKARYPRPTSGNTPNDPQFARLSRDARDSLDAGEGEKGRRGEGEKYKGSPAAAASPEVTRASEDHGGGGEPEDHDEPEPDPHPSPVDVAAWAHLRARLQAEGMRPGGWKPPQDARAAQLVMQLGAEAMLREALAGRRPEVLGGCLTRWEALARDRASPGLRLVKQRCPEHGTEHTGTCGGCAADAKAAAHKATRQTTGAGA